MLSLLAPVALLMAPLLASWDLGGRGTVARPFVSPWVGRPLSKGFGKPSTLAWDQTPRCRIASRRLTRWAEEVTLTVSTPSLT